MEFTLTTPALLFPAISLLLLAYTNRFLTLAGLLRDLKQRQQSAPNLMVRGQIENLRYRIRLIRDMQMFGVTAFFCCVLCMFLQFAGYSLPAKWAFALSLLLLLVSLTYSMREVQISITALELELHDEQ